MENTLGQMIGVVTHSFNITNDQGDKTTLSVKIDFSGSTNAEVKGWLTSNRTIAGQTSWRKLSLDELVDLNNHVFNATTIGHKVQSREERVATAMASGLPRNLAEFSVDNPEEFKSAMDKVQLDNA